jgi:hypothetical protein
VTQPHTSLTMRDQVYLLAHDEQGRPRIHAPSLNFGLAGAVIIDLILAERLAADANTIGIRSTAATGDVINDAVIGNIYATGRRQRRLRSWLTALSIDIADRTGGRLHAAGLVTQTMHKRIFRDTTVLYRCTRPDVLAQISHAIRFAVNGSNFVAPEHIALCGLLPVLRLERALNIEIPTTDLLAQLARVGTNAPPPARHVVAAVEHLIGETAVAAMR